MHCLFCQHLNAATVRACRVCGGPLRCDKPKIAPIAVATPVQTPIEIARHTFDESAAPLVMACFLTEETSRVCLVRCNGDVQLWNSESDEVSAFLVARRFRKPSSSCCAILACDSVITGYENGDVRWHNWSGRERKISSSHIGRVLSLASNATHLYSGGSDGVIWATEIHQRKPKSRALIEALGAMTTFAVAPDAGSIAVGCDDGAVCLWRFNDEEATFQLDWTRRGHRTPLASLAFSPNGQSLVSRDASGALCLWAAQTSYQLPLPPRAQCSHVAPAWSSDNRLLALSRAERAQIWDVALGTLTSEIAGLSEKIAHLSWATAAPWLLLASAREIAVWSF